MSPTARVLAVMQVTDLAVPVLIREEAGDSLLAREHHVRKLALEAESRLGRQLTRKRSRLTRQYPRVSWYRPAQRRGAATRCLTVSFISVLSGHD